MAQNDTDGTPAPNPLRSWLLQARGYVEHVGRQEQSHETFATTGIVLTPANRLRREAAEMDRLDFLIRDARRLLPLIDDALRRDAGATE